MPLGLWSVEWADLNSQRSYPLSDDATRMDVTGAFTLPNSFLIGFYLSVSWASDVDASQFFVSSIAVYPIGFAVSVSYNDGSSSPPLAATATFASATFEENTAYALTGVGSFSDSLGSIAVGSLDDINLQPAGQWAFNYAGGKLDPDTIKPQIRGVSAVYITSGGVTSAPLCGDITLVAGSNVQLTVVGQSVRIDAVEGAGLTETCECTAGTTAPTPILTINGIPPDNSGNFALVGDACLSVAASGSSITLSDLCSQPCCGCPELEALTTELAHVEDEATTLAAYLAALQAQVTNMGSNVLGSRLGDAPCLPPCA